MNSKEPSPAIVFETANAYQRSESLKAAVELDLFTHIANGRCTADEIASACDASRAAFESSRITSSPRGS